MEHLEEGTIHAWLDGALDAADAREAELHVAACAACAAAVAEARGLIAASSMILSKLDTEGGDQSASAARAQRAAHSSIAAASRGGATDVAGRQPRHWLQDARVRAAATLLILAGGAAAVGGVADRNEIGRMVDGYAVESSAPAGEEAVVPMSETAVAAAGDATAAAAPQPAPVAPPPTVKAVPQLPRPEPAVGATRAGPDLPSQRAVPGVTQAAASAQPQLARATGAEEAEAARGAVAGGIAKGIAPSPSPASAEPVIRRAEETATVQSDAAPLRAAVSVAPAPGVPGQPAAKSRSPIALGDTLAARLTRETRRMAEAPRAQLSAVPEADFSSGVATASASRCYALSLSPWSPAGRPLPVALPGRILLAPDTGVAGPAKGQRLIRPVGEGAVDGNAVAWWTEVSPSTLVLTWAAGREGIVMRLAGTGDTLAGTARTFGAEGGAERVSVATAQRVGCDAGR